MITIYMKNTTLRFLKHIAFIVLSNIQYEIKLLKKNCLKSKIIINNKTIFT